MAGNINGFNAPDNIGLNPTDRGSDAIAGAARRVGGFYTQVAGATQELGGEEGRMWKSLGQDAASDITTAGDVALKYQDHKEISAGAPAGANMLNNLDSAWNDIAKNADPNDPSIRQKFLQEQVQPTLDQFKEGFNTENSQAWADHFTDQIYSHLSTKTAADQSTLAGIAAQRNVTSTINTLSSTVYMDPSSLDTAIDTLKHSTGSIVGSSPTIDAATGARITSDINQKGVESLVKSAVSGMIEKNPNIDLDAIQKKYSEYINGAELKTFQKAAQTQAKQNALVDKQIAVLQRQQSEQSVRAASSKVIADNVTFDPQTGAPIIDPKFFKQSLDIVRKNPDAPNAAETFRTMSSWGESQQAKGAKPVDDPVVKSDLMTRMFSPDNPTTTLDLMKARAEGKISDPSFQALHGLVTEISQTPLKDPIFQDTIAAVKANLVLNSEGVPGKDIVGEGNYAKWAQTFFPQYLAAKRAGTLPPNALDVNDPKSMISQTMAPFHRDISQRAADYTNMLLGLDKSGGSNTPAPSISGHEVPAPLRGIAALQYNAAKNLWRDQTSGKVYDAAGHEVK